MRGVKNLNRHTPQDPSNSRLTAPSSNPLYALRNRNSHFSSECPVKKPWASFLNNQIGHPVWPRELPLSRETKRH